ncbi:hypothetical protein [Streptomyces sp. NPDC006193]|uniref:hypothetical protein n=1 Tax=Streptomyces sp. NPDC006193 TaxID=3155717 RepID=UPI0033B137F7
MSTHTQAEAQFSVALESIQGKRRIERVLEAANALLDRYSTRTDPAERLGLTYELIRRNLTPHIVIEYGDLALGAGEAENRPPGETVFHCKLQGPDGSSGSITASYTAPGSMGLTGPEWLAAMRLLAGISALGVGGLVTWPQ